MVGVAAGFGRVPLNDGAVPPGLLEAVGPFVPVPVKLFHVTDWACAAGAAMAHINAMASQRARSRWRGDTIGSSSTPLRPQESRAGRGICWGRLRPL